MGFTEQPDSAHTTAFMSSPPLASMAASKNDHDTTEISPEWPPERT
jgi:hypothetical protein